MPTTPASTAAPAPAPAIPCAEAVWTAADATGDAGIDAEHQALLAHCARLADCCQADATGFDEALAAFKALARAHLQTEASRLDASDTEAIEDLQAERDEFEAFAEDVVSTAYFDRVELQRFVTFWTLGHIRAGASPG